MQTTLLDNNDIIIPAEVQAKLDIAEGQYERGEFFKVDAAYFDEMRKRVMARLKMLKPHV